MTRTGKASRWVGATLLALTILTGAALAYDPDPSTPRAEIPAEYTWDWTHVFPNVEAWEAELSAVEALVPELATYENRLGESATCLRGRAEGRGLSNRMAHLWAYTQLRLDVELSNADNQMMQGKVGFLWQRFGASISYMEPELLSLPSETVLGFLDQKEELKVYDWYIRNIMRMKEHTLSKEAERILSQTARCAAPPPRCRQLRDIDLSFPTSSTKTAP